MLQVVSVKWDYDRFAESEKKHVSNQFFVKSHLGSFSNPATIVDVHGKILVWYPTPSPSGEYIYPVPTLLVLISTSGAVQQDHQDLEAGPG